MTIAKFNKEYWQRFNDEHYKKIHGYVKCPLIEYITEGAINTIDTITCKFDMGCGCCQDSRQNCKETFDFCKNCDYFDGIDFENEEDHKFKFISIQDAYIDRQKKS